MKNDRVKFGESFYQKSSVTSYRLVKAVDGNALTAKMDCKQTEK